ncbi:hypothetical protein [Thalassobaculum salexigens]|uniref:hypothetical protein n=1 Tax=Thalassobaculum salexigens TaxID=455360 RepID=UPI003CD0CCE5
MFDATTLESMTANAVQIQAGDVSYTTFFNADGTYSTDIGITGGGNGTHMVYIAGQPDHRLKSKDVVDHMVELIEKKAAEIEAEQAAADAGVAAE